MKTVFLSISILALLSACGSSDNSSGVLPPYNYPGNAQPHLNATYPTPGVAGVNSYSFVGLNSLGQPCATGVKQFPNTSAMCVNIQDPVQNNDCAAAARMQFFNVACNSHGFEFNESHVCRVTLLDKDAIKIGGAYPASEILGQQTFCAGRNAKVQGREFDNVNTSVALNSDVTAEVTMNFVPNRLIGPLRSSNFRLDLIRKLPDGETEKLGSYSYVNVVHQSHVGMTSDLAYKYSIDCAQTWACD